MSVKYKVKTAAVFNGQPVGSTIELDEATAKKYEALKYVKIIGKAEKPKPKAKAATKKKATDTKKKKDE